jgi:electron transfer flavoprotein alpha/beta subunit
VIRRAIVLVSKRDDLGLVKAATTFGDTTVLCALPDTPESEALLSTARDIGAARCVRLWDETLPGTDFLGLGWALASAVRKIAEPLDGALILCGDSGRAAVGPAVAERLGVPHLSDVLGVRVLDERLVARRRVGSVVRLYAAKAPMVLAMAAAAPASTEPDEAAGWTAALATTEAWSLADVGLQPTDLSYRRRFRAAVPAEGIAPPAARPRTFASATELVERLRADGVLPSLDEIGGLGGGG